MAKSKIITIVIIILLLLLPILSGCQPEEKETAWYQGIADSIKALQPTKIPDHLTVYSCNKTGTEFDVSKYFNVLTNLSMENGYTLDYVYRFEGSGGYPVLYVRAASQKPYANYEEYAAGMLNQAGIDKVRGIVTPLRNGQSGAFEDKIKIDGTKEGFFEYVVLQVLGNQFYLFWHANINDVKIVCEPAGIDAIVADVLKSEYQGGTPPDFEKKAKSLDSQPVIELKGDTATVSVLTFTRWGGFRQLTYTMKQAYPHTIIDIQIKTLLEYNCGIMF
jgi:hypothetical protein